jgi:hypothetical protein
MAEKQEVDPSGNTAQFRAFAQTPQSAPVKRSPVPLIAGIVVVVLVVAVVAWLAFS